MRMLSLSIRGSGLRVALILAGIWLSAPSAMTAQSVGNNAVYNSSGRTWSTAFIDASVLNSPNTGKTDLCALINDALYIVANGYGGAGALPGAVIDARGVTNLTCPAPTSGGAVTYTPWSYGGNTYNVPAKILLPAIPPSTAVIKIVTTWVVPGSTELIGQGLRDGGTVITGIASGGFGPPSPLVKLCSSSCTGVGIEGIYFEGGGNSVSLIENAYAADTSSYIDRINLHNFVGTGLLVDATASGSGLYSNVACSPGSTSSTCIEFDASNTGGLHGVTCTGVDTTGGSSLPAILLNSSNNTLEDIHLEGFQDGVLIGSGGDAVGDTLVNVNGSSGSGSINNVINISGPNIVADLTLVGAAAKSIDPMHHGNEVSYLLTDSLTGAIIPNGPATAQAFVSLYTVGSQLSGGYSRLTTSTLGANGSDPSIPTWGAGSSSVTGTSCSDVGAIYSNTSGTTGGNNTFFVCVGPAGSATWQPVI